MLMDNTLPLLLLVGLPMASLCVMLLSPAGWLHAHRCLALATVLLQVGCICLLWTGGAAQGSGTLVQYPWMHLKLGQWGVLAIDFQLGLDGLNIGMVGLAAVVLGAGTLASWSIQTHTRAYWALYLLLNALIMGSFEIHDDTGAPIPPHGNLERWAQQGVLLLNATLTVEARKAGSHQKKGWETFTDAVIRTVAQEKEHVVFLLWGAYAQQKAALIDATKHLVLTSAHPSPFSADRGFFGNRHFSRANAYLRDHQRTEIVW